MDWSPQQEKALKAVTHWVYYHDKKPFFYLAGYAGTGKTTLAQELTNVAHGDVAFAAYTGKAASVLSKKIGVQAKTIHSLIYYTEKCKRTGEMKTRLQPKSFLTRYALIVIDECSMIDEQMGNDLLSYRIPILVLGDPEQLPPIKGGGFFTSGEPDFMLTEVHRQAAESPIIRLATAIRSGDMKLNDVDIEGLRIGHRDNVDPQLIHQAGALICGTNKTRQNLNAWQRKYLGFSGIWPHKHETLICLRNDHDIGISNGQTFSVERSEKSTEGGAARVYELSDHVDKSELNVLVNIPKQFFEDELAASKNRDLWPRRYHHFTYGYAITCHKSQGSQWDNVCVFDESFIFTETRKQWLYTAVTRAAEHLTVIHRG